MRHTKTIVSVTASLALAAGAFASTGVAGAATSDDGAKATQSKYAFKASSYGSRLFNNEGQIIESGKTSWSIIGCTNQLGLRKTGKLAAADLGGSLKVGAVTTTAGTIRQGGGGAKSQSTSRIASVGLALPGTPPGLRTGLSIEGIKSVSYAQNNAGSYSQGGSVSIASINAQLAGVSLPIPIGDLSDVSPGEGVTIPGLAKLTFFTTQGKATKTMATNKSTALELKVLAPVPEIGGTTLRLGSAFTHIDENSPNGLLGGYGSAANGSLLDGLVKTSRVGYQILPCQGTDGKWITNPTAEVNLPGLKIAAGKGSTFGITSATKQVARARGRIGGVTLAGGELRIGAVQSQANVVRAKNKKGVFTVTKTGASKILSVKAGGEDYADALNEAAQNQESLTIPGLATLTPNYTQRGPKKITVTGLRIELLPDVDPLRSVVNLANSSARLR